MVAAKDKSAERPFARTFARHTTFKKVKTKNNNCIKRTLTAIAEIKHFLSGERAKDSGMKTSVVWMLFVLVVVCGASVRPQRRQRSKPKIRSLADLVNSAHRIVRRYTLGNEVQDEIMFRRTIERLQRTNGCTPQNFHNFLWNWKRGDDAQTPVGGDALPRDPFEVQKRQEDEDEAEGIIDFINELFAAYKRCRQQFCPDDR